MWRGCSCAGGTQTGLLGLCWNCWWWVSALLCLQAELLVLGHAPEHAGFDEGLEARRGDAAAGMF